MHKRTTCMYTHVWGFTSEAFLDERKGAYMSYKWGARLFRRRVSERERERTGDFSGGL